GPAQGYPAAERRKIELIHEPRRAREPPGRRGAVAEVCPVRKAQAKRDDSRLSGIPATAELCIGLLAVAHGCRDISQPPERLTQGTQRLRRGGLLNRRLERGLGR